jgi:hypothetical protein
MRRPLALGATTTLLLCALLPVIAGAAVIHVPDDGLTVQGALLAAAPYDTILVAPGTYYVNLEWPPTPGITLVSELGALTTILDGRDKLQVIGVYTGVDTTTVIRGFTIRNGHAEGQ